MFNPDDLECKLCEKMAYRKGLCYEHYVEWQEEKAERMQEEMLLRKHSREEEIFDSSEDV